jgi:hypothetical protein
MCGMTVAAPDFEGLEGQAKSPIDLGGTGRKFVSAWPKKFSRTINPPGDQPVFLLAA